MSTHTPTTRFEYNLLYFDDFAGDALLNQLNSSALQGWHLLTVIHPTAKSGGFVAVLERPLPNPTS
jgi:hypothetical protein